MMNSSVADAAVFLTTGRERKVHPSGKTDKRSHRNLLVGFLIVVVSLMPFTAGFERVGSPMDEGSLLVYPELIGRGALPYRDFETFYGPANLYVLKTVYSFFGINVIIERSVGLLYRALILSSFSPVSVAGTFWRPPVALCWPRGCCWLPKSSLMRGSEELRACWVQFG
jgi:hypothetical protein